MRGCWLLKNSLINSQDHKHKLLWSELPRGIHARKHFPSHALVFSISLVCNSGCCGQECPYLALRGRCRVNTDAIFNEFFISPPTTISLDFLVSITDVPNIHSRKSWWRFPFWDGPDLETGSIATVSLSPLCKTILGIDQKKVGPIQSKHSATSLSPLPISL